MQKLVLAGDVSLIIHPDDWMSMFSEAQWILELVSSEMVSFLPDHLPKLCYLNNRFLHLNSVIPHHHLVRNGKGNARKRGVMVISC